MCLLPYILFEGCLIAEGSDLLVARHQDGLGTIIAKTKIRHCFKKEKRLEKGRITCVSTACACFCCFTEKERMLAMVNNDKG